MELVRRHNEVVGEGDPVFMLGDFTLNNRKYAQEMFARLNGYIYVLGQYGHHDRSWLPGCIGVPSVSKGIGPNLTTKGTPGGGGLRSKTKNRLMIYPPMLTLGIPVEGEKYPKVVVLSHFPLEVWDRKHYGSYHLHGHSHGNLPPRGRRMDVGVDCTDFRPINLIEAMERIDANVSD
jgi:calcineurin-like phosphoesterase family protein